MGRQRDKAAIAGVGATNFGALYSRGAPCSAYDLAGNAFALALDDCGIDKAEIDGIICVRLPSYQRVATELGLPHRRLAHGLEATGRMAGVALQQAADAVRFGRDRCRL